jgi:hypothetical protein
MFNPDKPAIPKNSLSETAGPSSRARPPHRDQTQKGHQTLITGHRPPDRLAPLGQTAPRPRDRQPNAAARASLLIPTMSISNPTASSPAASPAREPAIAEGRLIWSPSPHRQAHSLRGFAHFATIPPRAPPHGSPRRIVPRWSFKSAAGHRGRHRMSKQPKINAWALSILSSINDLSV